VRATTRESFIPDSEYQPALLNPATTSMLVILALVARIFFRGSLTVVEILGTSPRMTRGGDTGKR
jgi:hypothetical protein